MVPEANKVMLNYTVSALSLQNVTRGLNPKVLDAAQPRSNGEDRNGRDDGSSNGNYDEIGAPSSSMNSAVA
jgi:hypothetical protein